MVNWEDTQSRKLGVAGRTVLLSLSCRVAAFSTEFMHSRVLERAIHI